MELIVDWQLAVKMLKAYQKHPRAILLNPGIDSKLTHGFYVTKQEMKNVVDRTPGDHIILLPAVHPDDLLKPSAEQNLTIIFAALNATGEIDVDNAFDYCLPCPNACPGNYPIVP